MGKKRFPFAGNYQLGEELQLLDVAIAQARKTDECKEVERQGMEDLRLKLNITVTTEAEYLKTKRRKSTQRVEDQMEEVPFMYEA